MTDLGRRMQTAVDRPADRLLTGRVEILSGSLACRREDFSLRATCGEHELPVEPCPHPARRWDRDLCGFWTLLFVQELLDAVEGDLLRVDLRWGDSRLGSIPLRVLPMARQLALDFPLNLDTYEVSSDAVPEPCDPPRTIVFPGLGAVGGSSLNQLLRVKMLREGWAVPVYSEPDAPEIWADVCADDPPCFRWIDGHGCFSAASSLGPSFARVTLLREPLARLLSALDYGSLVHPDLLPFSCLDDLVESGAARMHSQAVGLLRCAGMHVAPDLPDADLYALAKEQLDREYALVGVTELFEESIFLLCALAGYSSIGMWWRVLAAPRSLRLEDLSPRIRSRLERLFEVDTRLHDESRRKLVETLARFPLGGDFPRFKAAAKAQPDPPAIYRAFECLRWRQELAESELRIARARAVH